MTPPTTPDDVASRLAGELDDAFLSLKRGGTEIYLIRHADALPGADDVVAGGYDDQALSALGRRQAQALADRLRATELAAIYSSPTARALQTAQPTAEALGLEVRIEDGLREVQLGTLGPDSFPSATPAELAEAIRQRLREVALIAVGSGTWAGIPGTEPSDHLRARITATIARLAEAHPGQRIAAVSHAGTINACFAAMLGLQRDYFFPTINTGVSILRAKGPRRLLLALNDTAHLHAAGLLGPST